MLDEVDDEFDNLRDSFDASDRVKAIVKELGSIMQKKKEVVDEQFEMTERMNFLHQEEAYMQSRVEKLVDK